MTAPAPAPVTLESGWGPATAEGDTLLRRVALGWAASLLEPTAAMGGRVAWRDGLALADLGRPGGFLSGATVIAPPAEGSWPDVLMEAEGFLAGPGADTVWLWSPFPTPDLSRWGWELAGHPPILWHPDARALAQAAEQSAGDVVVREVTEGREVTGPGELAVWNRIVVEGYPLPELAAAGLPYVTRGALSGAGLRLWTAHLPSGPPVAAAALHLHGDLASLAMGVTLPAGRRHGAWAALVAARARAAGTRSVFALCSDDSQPGLRRFGCIPLVRWTAWTRPRPG